MLLIITAEQAEERMESVQDYEEDQLSSTGDSEEDESSSVEMKTDGELIEREFTTRFVYSGSGTF